MGKSFEYWKNLHDKGIIDKHAVYLQLVHLKYAVDQNLITSDEYYVHRLRITNKFSPSSKEYKSCTLMDFGKALNAHSLANKLEILETDQCSEKLCEEQKQVMDTFKKTNQQNETIVNLNENYNNPDKEQEDNNQTQMPKKSKRKRKKKKKRNNNYNNIEIKDYVQDECYTQIENSAKQMFTSKDLVKIYVRQVNKKYQNAENVNQKSLQVSSKRCAREIFSNILKQFKKEKLLQR